MFLTKRKIFYAYFLNLRRLIALRKMYFFLINDFNVTLNDFLKYLYNKRTYFSSLSLTLIENFVIRF